MVALVEVHIGQALSRSLVTLLGGNARYPWELVTINYFTVFSLKAHQSTTDK